ncbi:putative endonuclease [Enhygromyxa salina]|uniref:UPF0102 protein DB30_00396 n=1 Tax=Enhygromyxa salina TaxID=215803 RepID=A0A0C2CZH3_9BACT|nr:YraN family protein [Enhygromyxa salina]KIG13252.1 putative endonuclease [Enhygromyxa salina]
MSKHDTRKRGRAGEDQAAALLLERGLEILDRNVTCAGAELDLIARDGETIVFVEVRSRADDLRGHPLETIDARKRSRLRRGATGWLVQRDLWERVPVRFDVVTLVGEHIQWLQDAF